MIWTADIQQVFKFNAAPKIGPMVGRRLLETALEELT